MPARLAALQGRLAWLFGPDRRRPGFLWSRWLWLRALAVLFGSAFVSLAFQIHGLIGPHGILPARMFLDSVKQTVGVASGVWRFPSVLWLGSGSGMLTALWVLGLAASVALLFNLWPRASLVVATGMFGSFVWVAQAFAAYQSDGMLIAAGVLSWFLSPPGLKPGLGAASPPSRAARWLLMWEWLRIYAESGVAKILGGDPEWRHLTAMDHYYENGPLPTWIAWYAQHLPHWFHAATALATLTLELLGVWLVVVPRRKVRVALFAVVTTFQAGIILTANYAFLNYLVLSLGFLLLDDGVFARLGLKAPDALPPAPDATDRAAPAPATWRLAGRGAVLGLIFYSTVILFPGVPGRPLPRALTAPVARLQAWRVANAYGLFAVMTRKRYELELQGSDDGIHWKPYGFAFKPQDPKAAPGIYAPYQPRFDWDLWFASLDHSWRDDPWVLRTEALLLRGEPSVIALFAHDPFPGRPPKEVRVVRWRYRFSTRAEKALTGRWWDREDLGVWGPTLTKNAQGRIVVAGPPPR